MPRIPLYEQRTRATGSLGAGPTGGTGSPIGQGLQYIADVRREREESTAAAEAGLALAKAREDWQRTLIERQESAEIGAPDFTRTLIEEFDESRRQLLSTARTPRARQFLETNLTNLRGSLFEQATKFEAGARIKQRETLWGQSVEHARTAAQFNPGDFDTLLDEQMTAIAAGGHSRQRAAELAIVTRERLAEAAVMGMVQRDPRQALAELNKEDTGVTAIRSLSFDDRNRLRGAAQSEVNRLEMEARAAQAEMRAALSADLQDAFAARQMGITASMPSRGRFIAAYGGEEGANRYTAASKRWQAYDIAAQVAFLPPAEAAEKLAAMKPVEQAGAADSAEAYAIGVKLYEQQRKMLEADPVGVLLQSDPKIAAAQQAAAQDPSQTEAYLGQLLARQQALGIAEPKLLPAAARDAAAAALTFDPKAPLARVERLEGMRQAYGDYFSQVVREIAPKLDGHARVLVDMAPEQAMQLDAALAQKGDLEKIVAGTNLNDITAGVDAELADLAESLAQDVDGPERLAEHRSAAILLARSYVARGEDPGKAARKAAAAVVTDAYTFRDGVRIPSSVDDGEVMEGADLLRRKVAESGRLQIAPGQVNGETAQADLAALVRKKGYWVTSPDGSGLTLYIPHRKGAGRVYREDGTPVAFTWEELANTGANRAQQLAAWEVPYAMRGPLE